MQGPPTTPTEDAEASIPTEHVRNGPNLNHTFTLRRKAAKRTFPWELTADEPQLASPPPQDEDIRETKRPRLEEPVATSTDEATAETTLHDITLVLSPPDAPSDAAVTELITEVLSELAHDGATTDHVTDIQPNARTTGATGRWTPEEDAKLISAITKTPKTKQRRNWVAIAALVPGRTKIQCQNRWHNAWDSSIDGVNGCTGTWKEDEDIKLKTAVQKYGGKDWVAISALVPGRTKKQCQNRWQNVLDPSIDGVNGCYGKWKEEEDIKLKSAVRKHGGKNWVAIAALVPGRTKMQCQNRWHNAWDSSIDGVNGCTGTWKEDEDIKLKTAVQKYGDKDWVAISALVPGRTNKQCWSRWHDALDPSIDRVNGCTGTWKVDEDIMLKDAVRKNGGTMNWITIAALVPGRTKMGCCSRWYNSLDPSIDRVNRCTGKWKEEEDIKLKDAVRKHGGNDWIAIAAAVPGRTIKQCKDKWHNALDPSIGRMKRCTGKWKEGEIIKLKDAVRKHGDTMNWAAIAALVPARTKMQCQNKWHSALNPSIIDRVSGCTGVWKDDEDIKLKVAVQTHGDKNWIEVAALVPGRTGKQCYDRSKSKKYGLSGRGTDFLRQDSPQIPAS
jgi:hypothetical protein